MKALKLLLPALILFTVIQSKLIAENTVKEKQYYITPIGIIKNNTNNIELVIDRKYQDGMLGLDKFSHIWVIW